MTTCPACDRRTATHTNLSDSLCGPCSVATQTQPLGVNEGRIYECQPLHIDGVVVSWEVYERSRDGRRFHCTMQEWPSSAAARRIGPVAAQDGLRDREGA